MIEANRHPGIKALARAGLAALTLVAAGDARADNPCADAQRDGKTVATYNDMVVTGIDKVEPGINYLCPPEKWKLEKKEVKQVITCGHRGSPSSPTHCLATNSYQFWITCIEK